LKDIFLKYGQYVSQKEICGLIDRYDRSKDGKISYQEFLEEL
jgi:Ca2+-binding EF-hand superfamily protein